MEGLEPGEFWDFLGGKTEDYNKVDKKKAEEILEKPVKLFINPTGKTFLPANRHSPSYLMDTCCAILDTIDELFLWLGSKCTEGNKNLAKMFAEEYLTKAGRKNKVVIVVEPGKEPFNFSKHFHAWPYKTVAPTSTIQKVVDQYKTTFTLEELQSKASLPPHVDRQKLEDYLTEEDFPSAFGLTKEQFFKQPAWKRTVLKKKIDLF